MGVDAAARGADDLKRHQQEPCDVFVPRGVGRPPHVQGDQLATADAFAVAQALADAIREEQADLILTGLQSDDQGFAQVGVVLAEKLGVSHSTIIMLALASSRSTAVIG